MSNLKEMLSEKNGQVSTMRVVASVIPLIIILTWAFISIKTGRLVSFDLPDVAALGLPLVAKAYQRGKEQ